MTETGSDILEWQGGRLDFSGGTLVMGILNVTPDSFSDGGEFFDVDRAVGHGMEMAAAGAAVIDIGGESTRPGSQAVAVKQQIQRVVPVIEALTEKVETPISIDTRDYAVAAAAVDAGASIVNDISALSDERTARLAAQRRLPVVLMHMQGEPATMQVRPEYGDVVKEVRDYLVERARYAESVGVASERIFIDPGIGFGKTHEHNLLLLKHLDAFVATGYRVLVGASRKGFLGRITDKKIAAERIFGTAATVALCATAGVSIVRVHDAVEMADVVKVVNAIMQV